jgi:sugar transferase (PEP-CTERM/EpsH1 system associated)
VHILWIKTELLHPVDKGGRIRTYNMLRELRRSHRVTYLALDDGHASPEAMQRAGEYANEVVRVPFRTREKRSAGFYGELLANLASRLPYAIAKYRSPELTRRLEACVARGDVDVVVCDFLAPSLNVPDSLSAPTVLFQHNVEAVIWERHAANAGNPLARVYMKEQWRRMRAFEASECRRFDHVVAVSEQDRATFQRDYGMTRVSAVPTGVDTEYFSPTGKVERNPRELVFTGSMDWLPNEDAIVHFAHAILPLIRTRLPDVTLTVVGRNPTPKLLALAEQQLGVTVTGSVPDVRPYLERAAAFVVPIRIGGGTRLKIYEAMAMGKAVVSTAVGAEGLPVTSGTDVLLADDPQPFADAVISLLESPETAAELGRRAQEWVRAEFGWAMVARRFAEICETAAHEWRTTGRGASGPGRGRTYDSPALAAPADATRVAPHR